MFNSERKVHCFGDNINTDIIISGKYLRTKNEEIFKEHIFETIKGEGYFKKIDNGDVILGGFNFGCGSSREQAALAIKYAGFKIVIAKSYGRIFYRNIINQGILTLNINEESFSDTNKIKDSDKVVIDMQSSLAIFGNTKLRFEKPSSFLLEIIQAGGLLNYAKEKDSNNSRRWHLQGNISFDNKNNGEA